MMLKIVVFLYILTSRIRVVRMACDNRLGDSNCTALMAKADYCHLSKAHRCDCAKECEAPTECEDPVDSDESCECRFYANKFCAEEWMKTGCSYSCFLRNTVTCPSVSLSFLGASLRYNGEVPTYSPARFMDEATYECKWGYRRVLGPGASKPLRRVCSRRGQWVLDPDQQEAPDCEPINCGPPPTIPLTTHSPVSGKFEDRVNYTCDLSLSHPKGGGSGQKMCAKNDTWLDDGDTLPVCLGLAVKFVHSKIKAKIAPPGLMTSHSTRSKLECASRCANKVDCFGFTFDTNTKSCQMNTAAASPVSTTMERVLA